MPASLARIEEHTFYNCTSLQEIQIPSGVTSVETEAFYGCTNLKAVKISDVAFWCGIDFAPDDNYDHTPTSNPLYYAKHLILGDEEVTSLVIPEGVTSVCDFAFYNCENIKSVVIPSTVTSIGAHAFKDCGMESVSIPSSVTSIGHNAFTGLNTVIIYAKTPPKCTLSGVGYVSFGVKNYSESKLYVPKGCAEAYKDWSSMFYDIIEMEE